MSKDFIDLFLLEAEEKEPEEEVEGEEPEEVPEEEVNPQMMGNPMMGEASPQVPPHEQTKDIVKYNKLDLNVTKVETSRYFTFNTIQKMYENLKELSAIQDRMITQNDEKISKDFNEIKDKTKRFKEMFYKFLLVFNSYNQKELDVIKEKFEKVITELVKETKSNVTLLNINRTNF